MDQSYSESDVSLSPSQILERLQVLRQLQLLQRGKLQKQRLEYQEISENSSSITEIVSHFSNSTSYNTFRSLLESAHDFSNDGTPRVESNSLSQKVKERDLLEGVAMLNLSQESEFMVNSPLSSRSLKSAPSRNEKTLSPLSSNTKPTIMLKNQIALDDMPILSPKKDFEAMLMEKLQVENTMTKTMTPPQRKSSDKPLKRPFLRKGEGMSRFGLQKKDLVIQNTKALPWRRQSLENKNIQSPLRKEINKMPKIKDKRVSVDIVVSKQPNECTKKEESKVVEKGSKDTSNATKESLSSQITSENVTSALMQLMQKPITLATGKHPLKTRKRNTWASVLNKEQNDFLRQLKQSEYYKNFTSPAKSTLSDASCDETLTKLRNEREIAEQNMFELLESKVSHESFSMDNSFLNKFLRRTKLEYTGQSTPLVMQHCLANNPDLMHIHPSFNRKRNQDSHSDVETCQSDYNDCCSETCSSVSSCCSCKTVEETNQTNNSTQQVENNKKVIQKNKQKGSKEVNKKDTATENNKEDKNDTGNDNDNLQSNMVEMNAKLIATSELLKDRLRELEDEIETFRQENANLSKLREEIDAERQKFYEEKAMFEQKFNEEKILSEYYLAEEKEKLTKQKQMYDKYVREMRGRLNKKDKDEVLNLRKEICDLKEEIRLKDSKSTASIARLRNQIKLMEKEKKSSEEEIEKLKKENRRIQHSNDMTRRMTNLKYLEQINKKLSNITAKETQSEVVLDSNAKYKTFEIETQSRSKKVQPDNKDRGMRTRAKSVPNLNVKSRYAKYFSQRDVLSDLERNKIVNIEPLDKYDFISDNDDDIENEIQQVHNDSIQNSDNEDDNNLEKLYIERFHSVSPKSSRSNVSNPSTSYNSLSHPDTFFLSKSNSNRDSKSPTNTISPFDNSNSNRSKSPTSILSHRSSDQRSPRNYVEEMNINRDGLKNLASISRGSTKSQSKSPVSILTNRSSVQKPATVIQNENYKDRLSTISPDPSSSKSSLTKTILNPTEIKKPDGSRELRFPNGNLKFLSADGKYSKFFYYNGDVKENFYNEGRIKYFYAETKTYHTTHADGLEVLEFNDGQVEKRYKDGSTEIRLPNGSVRYFDPKNEHVREEWRFPDGAALTISASGEQRIVFSNGQVEVHAKDHKRREFPDGTVKLVYNDGTSETRYASGRVRIKDKHGNLIMDSATG